MGVEPKIGGTVPPKSSHVNRAVFHDFHHPFWGATIFGSTPVCWRCKKYRPANFISRPFPFHFPPVGHLTGGE